MPFPQGASQRLAVSKVDFGRLVGLLATSISQSLENDAPGAGLVDRVMQNDATRHIYPHLTRWGLCLSRGLLSCRAQTGVSISFTAAFGSQPFLPLAR